MNLALLRDYKDGLSPGLWAANGPWWPSDPLTLGAWNVRAPTTVNYVVNRVTGKVEKQTGGVWIRHNR